MAKRKKLFIDSEDISHKDIFIFRLESSGEFEGVDLEYYYEVIKDWSLQGNNKKVDWFAASRNWIRRAIKEHKNPVLLEGYEFKNGKISRINQPLEIGGLNIRKRE